MASSMRHHQDALFLSARLSQHPEITITYTFIQKALFRTGGLLVASVPTIDSASRLSLGQQKAAHMASHPAACYNEVVIKNWAIAVVCHPQ